MIKVALVLIFVTFNIVAKDNMNSNFDQFLTLSSTAWSAVSSLLTLMAIITALFLPFWLQNRKSKNISKLIDIEKDRK